MQTGDNEFNSNLAAKRRKRALSYLKLRNRGLSVQDIANKEGISRQVVYSLLKQAKAIPI